LISVFTICCQFFLPHLEVGSLYRRLGRCASIQSQHLAEGDGKLTEKILYKLPEEAYISTCLLMAIAAGRYDEKICLQLGSEAIHKAQGC